MQSLVYDTALNTHENLLVSAPTSAGKTDVAMLCMLSCIRLHRLDDGSSAHKLDTAAQQFKMVYVAPMKALATEITRKFSTRLQKLGVQCREWTGDMQLTQQEI